MECNSHGVQKPSFICHHLRYGEKAGFVEASEDPDPDYPFREAWCGTCDKVLLEQGEWNDVSEGHAQFMAICEGCLNEIKARNE